MRFGIIENVNCPICNVVSTTEHFIFNFYIPKYFIHAFVLFLDNMYNHQKPEFIFLKETFIF